MNAPSDRVEARKNPALTTLIVSHSREVTSLFSGVSDVEVVSNVFRAIGRIAVDTLESCIFGRVILDRPGLENTDTVARIVKTLSPAIEVMHGDSGIPAGEAREKEEILSLNPQILIVDDEPSIRESLSEILDFKGYVAEGAADGHEAIGKVIYRKFLGHEYKMILMDLKLKPDLHGAEAACFIDGLPPEFRVCSSLSYISAFLSTVNVDRHGEVRETGDFSLMHRFEHLNFIRSLHKPVDVEELLQLVSEGIATHDLGGFLADEDSQKP
ncbi:MAG: response regulator [Candidatus Latescibacteria bacterium]|nr:response regulator [Candidatus Latescibacterota bacterium]